MQTTSENISLWMFFSLSKKKFSIERGELHGTVWYKHKSQITAIQAIVEYEHLTQVIIIIGSNSNWLEYLNIDEQMFIQFQMENGANNCKYG